MVSGVVAAHVNTLRALLRTAAANLDRGIVIECKHFFSGAAAYADGRIFMTLTSVGTALKLPPASQAMLFAQGAKPLRYFPSGPIKKDYVIVPEPIASNADILAAWIVKSVKFSRTSPKPRRARRAGRRDPR